MPSFVWWLRDWNTVFRWMPYSWTAFQCIPDNEEPRPSKPSVLPYSGKHFDKSHKRCGHPYSLNLFFLYCSSLYYYWTVFFLLQRQFSFYPYDSFPPVCWKDFCPSAPEFPVALLHRYCSETLRPDVYGQSDCLFTEQIVRS